MTPEDAAIIARFGWRPSDSEIDRVDRRHREAKTRAGLADGWDKKRHDWECRARLAADDAETRAEWAAGVSAALGEGEDTRVAARTISAPPMGEPIAETIRGVA